MNSEQLVKLFIALSVFGLIIAIWLAGITFWWLKRTQRNRKLERRLQFAEQGVADEERIIRLWHDGKAIDAFVPDFGKMGFAERLERMRQDAGWQMPMPRILAILAVFIVASAVMIWAVSGKILLPLAVA